MFKQCWAKMMSASLITALCIVILPSIQAWGQPKPGGTLRIAIAYDLTRQMDARYLYPESLYPAQLQIYEFLVGFGAKGMDEIAPWLAESWKQVDPLTYLFSLRKGVKFHNGREMTAEDIKTLFDWNLKTPESWEPLRRRAFLVRVLDKVETVDRYGLRIKLKVPFAPFISTLRMVQQGIVPPEEVKKWGKDFTLHPNGTGPFKFVQMVPGDRVVLERFEGYWGKIPHLDRVIFRTIPDEHSRIIALQTGEIDATRIDLSGLPVVRKDPNLKALTRPHQAVYGGVFFNVRNWPLSSLKFRTAIVMGADWDKFPQAVYVGTASRTPLARTWAENPKAGELVPPYDPEKARRLVKEVEAEAGRAIPTVTWLITPVYVQSQMAALARTFLKKIGVDIRVEIRELVPATLKTLKWDIVAYSPTGPGADPYFQLNYFSTVGEGDMPDGKNVMGYVNPKIDELLKSAAATEARDARKKLYQEIESILLRDLPVFYTHKIELTWVTNKKVQDFGLLNDGGIYLTTPWNNTWMER